MYHSKGIVDERAIIDKNKNWLLRLSYFGKLFDFH